MSDSTSTPDKSNPLIPVSGPRFPQTQSPTEISVNRNANPSGSPILPTSGSIPEKSPPLIPQTGPRFPPNQSPTEIAASGSPVLPPSGSSGSSIPHFSTPPGPPVFSSPLRPAAVPFRASPASPQTVPFSSHSSLPTSSPSLFANGSSDKLLKISEGSEDSGFDSPLLLFSAHKVLKDRKLANTPSLGFGALISSGREISSGPQIIEREPHRCSDCGAYANPYCKILLSSGQWQCSICKKLCTSNGDYIAASLEAVRQWPELSSPCVDYVKTANKHPGFVPISDSRSIMPVFLIIDECLDEAHLQHLQGSLHAFADSLPETTRIGIITYGRTVSVYDFSEGSAASADVLPGGNFSQESLKSLIYGTGIYLSPVHASLPVAHTIFSSLRPFTKRIPEASRDRCLGTAVEVALAIIRGPSGEISSGVIKRPGSSCRILVCAGGPNTFGPGSVPHSFDHPNYPYMEKSAIKFMEDLGHKAHGHNITIDILCAGTCPIRVPVLQPLAKTSGGVLILHDDFGEAFGVNLQRASSRASGSHGLLEIRCSDDILITQVIGPGEEESAESLERFKNDVSTRVRMLSVEETQSFSLSMELKNDIENNHVFFQFAIQFSTTFQAEISRVITIRLPAVESLSSYLESIQADVVSVLMAKRTLLRASQATEAVNMRFTIDERLKDIAAKFGGRVAKSKMYRFPKELTFLPENLFHLRRGPLLGSILGHEDERSVMRSIFLNAGFDLSLRMVAPRCLMHREGGDFEELPAYDLAMQSDAAIVLDHGTDVFIWLGAELASQEGKSAAALAACRMLAEELTEQRFPAPRILSFKEGSSQARYLVSRMIPAHRDPPYEQESRFPQLTTLTAEQRTRLKSSFLHFDDVSFCEWMRSLKLVPPEPS